MKIDFDTSLKIAGIGLVPWTRLGPEQWLPEYAIASLYGWDLGSEAGAVRVVSLSDRGELPQLERLNTAALLKSSEFQALLNDELPGYDLLTYKPVKLPEALADRKLLCTDPAFTERYENKVWFRQRFSDRLTFPTFQIYERLELLETAECFDRLLAGRDGMVIQDELLSGGKGTFLVRAYEQYLEAVRALERLSSHSKVVISDLLSGPRERSIQACVTKDGVVVGPLQQQIVRHPLLANMDLNDGDKFCGAQIMGEDFEPEVLAKATAIAQSIGAELSADGYKGIFGVDFLLDDSGTLYTIEINPRITGVTPLLTAMYRGEQGIPFYLLHLLELGSYPYEITDTTARFDKTGSLLVLHSLEPTKIHIDTLPPSGTYRVQGDGIELVSRSIDVSALDADQFIFQEYMPPNMVVKPGGRLATVQFNRLVLDSGDGSLLADVEAMVRLIHATIRTTAADN